MAAVSKRIPTLDGWRAIAISSVIVHHVAAQRAILMGYPEPWAMYRFAMGVDVFFAISGLLITKLLLDHWEQTGNLGLRGFYIRRVFRILPPALCYLGLMAILHLFSGPLDWISSLTFWRNYLPFHLTEVYTDHYWSLSLEEQFYLIWPCTLALAGRERAPKVLFWTILALNVWRMFAMPSSIPNFILRTDVRGDGLLWGCMAAFAYAQFPRFRIPGYVFVLCAVFSPLLFSAYAGMTVFPITVGAMVLATVQNPGWSVSRALEWWPLTWIGKRSYGIYIWQQFFIAYGDVPGPFWVSVLLRLAALLIVTEISYIVLERPLQQFGRRITEKLDPANRADFSTTIRASTS